MRQFRQQSWYPPPPLVVAVGLVALLLPAAVGAGVAAAAPAAGYTASLIPTGRTATVAVDPDTDTVYFGNVSSYNLTVVNGSTNTVTSTIGLSAACTSIAVDPATDTLYVAVAATTSTPPAVDVIDGATNTVTGTIALSTGSKPNGVAVDSSTDTVYVAESGAPAVAVIDGATNAVTTTIGTGSGTEPSSVAVDETTDVVWVGGTTGDVLAINGTSNSVTQTISPGGGAVASVAVNPDTDTIYAATETGGVAVIDGATGAISTTISVTTTLYAVAVDPGSGAVFASSYDGATLMGTTWVIDGGSNTVTDTIERGGIQTAVNTATGSVYEAGYEAQPYDAWALTPSAANAESPVITSQADVTFNTVGDNSFDVTASALPAATYTESGQLPAGVGLSSSGVLAGTPAADSAGTYPITITASNGVAPDYSQDFTLTVDELPVITIPSSATVQVGTPVSIPIQVTGSPAATSVGIYANAPPGLTVTAEAQGSWVLDGTPAAGSAGVYDTVIYATNANGTSTATIDITIAALSITSADQAVFAAGRAGSFTVTATGSPAPALSESGALPAGVAFSSAGVLAGTPAASSAGTYSITITASNAGGTVTQAFTLIVDVPGAPPAAGGVLGDVTGDGLADILAVDGSGNLWLYPNTGSGDASMFADGRSQVGSGWNGYTLAATAELYGATKAGILAIAPGGNLWYYPNTGLTGTSTFGSRSLVGTGWTGYTVVGVTDLYGVAQPGILATDPAGNLWYYPGNGGTGTSTFGARSQIGSGWTGWTADVAIVGTTPDLLGIDPSGTMWLYATTGSTGTSTFGTPTQVSTGWAGYQAIDTGTLTASASAAILGIDPAGNLWYYPSAANGTFGTPVQVGTGWTGYRIN
jgi:large repetitive protein